MKIIESSVSLISENNPIIKVEMAGRTCYKSNSEFNQSSASSFLSKLDNHHHFAMMEHGQITFEICGLDERYDNLLLSIPYLRWTKSKQRYYITLSISHLKQGIPKHIKLSTSSIKIFDLMKELFINNCNEFDGNKTFKLSSSIESDNDIQVTLYENIDNISELSYEDYIIHKSLSFKFICDRGVSHELVRHRCSIAQESQRYCNYTKNKFNQEITFIYPSNFKQWSEEEKSIFYTNLIQCEKSYFKLIELGKTPQEARSVLPNATKTELILTMPIYQWQHFINIRSKGTTGTPHPDMKVLADNVSNVIDSLLSKKY